MVGEMQFAGRGRAAGELRGLGGEPGTMTVEQFTRFNAQEYERFGRLIREANIKPE